MINIAIKLATSITYTADGSQTNFSVPFDYLRPSFVHVAVNDAEVSEGFTISNRMVMFDAAPAKGAVVHIYRNTPTTRLVSWADASILKAIDMTIAEVQQLHILEEASDWSKTNSIVLDEESGVWQGRKCRVSNVADPTEAQDVVTKNYLENTEDSFVQRMNAIKTQTEQFANTAGNSKDSAYKSAQSASTSAASAAESAELTSGYKQEALTAKNAAATSATNAKASEANAKTSENNAEASKEAAQSAASAASNYASAARNSAGDAKTYMDNAKNYSENVNVFVPSVSDSGVLSWTNRAGLPNPASVNIKGAKGDTGTAATIEVGTVTTGAAGSSASVVNRGDVNNAILDFVLPKGADGKGAVITVNGKEPDAGGNVNVEKYTHPNSGVTAGTYRSVTVNAQGHVTAGSNPTLAIADGGTGATTAKQARENLEIEPIGTIFAFAGNDIPSGYLPCNGSAISRTTYADLFAVIGTTYGSGDDSTTFNLPNLTDRFIQGSSVAGQYIDAGLPNITGRRVASWGGGDYGRRGYTTGCFKQDTDKDIPTTINGENWNSEGNGTGFAFDASRSNPIYGNSTTVQPPAVTMRYIIKY